MHASLSRHREEERMSRTLTNQVRRAALAGLAVVFATVAWTGPAAASSDGSTSGVVATGGGRLNVRSEPSLSGKLVGTKNNASRLTLVCQVKGDKVRGSRKTTTMWNQIKGGGYVSDAYVKHGKNPPLCSTLKEKAKSNGSAVTAKGDWRRPVNAKVWSGFHTKDRPTHDGVDLGAPRFTKIRAAAAGTVVVATCNASTNNCDKDGSWKVMGCGWYVDIEHAGGIVTRYCHMVTKPYVKVGQKVEIGTVLGRVGSSGNSSGPHLHFEVHVPEKSGGEAVPVNPIKFYADLGLELSVG
jgi:murein DD-endopeptidase MepM/ murein hydrolase activator NlpD